MNGEHLSAHVDGELDEPQQRVILADLRNDVDAVQTWNTYHMIGEVLREKRVLHMDVAGRVAQALIREPTPLVPKARRLHASTPARWLAVAAAVAVVALSTRLLQWNDLSGSVAPVAQNTASAPPTQVVQANPALNPPAQLAQAGNNSEAGAYVAMHHQWSPLSGFQAVDYVGAGAAR